MTRIRFAVLLLMISSWALSLMGCPLVEDTREPDGGADTR
jgi:hypothetical protein